MNWQEFKKLPFIRVMNFKSPARIAKEIERDNEFEALTEWLDKLPAYYEGVLEKAVKDIEVSFGSVDVLSKSLKPHKNIFQLAEKQGMSKPYKSFTNGHYVDASQFTNEQMLTLVDKFMAVHDVALKYNVELQFAGFDNMPRSTTAFRNSCAYKRGAAANMNLENTYNEFTHPEFGFDDMSSSSFTARKNSRFNLS